MPPKIIIFDLGNVILTDDDVWYHGDSEQYDVYTASFSISPDDMKRGWNAAWPQFRIGQITEDEFWTIFLKTAGTRVIDIERAKELWRKCQKPIESMLDLLSKLKPHYELAALTNTSKEWFDFKRGKYKLDDYFRVMVSSAYSGLAKPDERIYELTLRGLGAKPEECLFVDDTERNVAVAREVGMMTILFRGQEDLEGKLRKLGIVF